MFRYIALSWNEALRGAAEAAQRIGSTLGSRRGWQLAFSMAGHCVYTTGTAEGVNDVHLLPGNQGLIVGRLFRRSPDPKHARNPWSISDQDALHIVHTDGRALVERFWGRYVAFLPSWTGEARMLRDPTGSLPCFRVDIQGVCVVLSWLDDLEGLIDTPRPGIHWDGVAAHMLFGRLCGRGTALDGVTQVLPGELTPLSSRGIAPVRLWSAVEIARQVDADEHGTLEPRLRETALHCLSAWASCYDSILVRLSGGLDSAILLASLRAASRRPQILALNYFSAGSDSDERRYARLAAERMGTRLIERQRHDETSLQEVLGVARTAIPPNYLGALGSRGLDFEVAADHGASVVFTGAGGDQLFFEFQCTWPAADYLTLRGLDTGFFEAVLDAALLGRVSFWRALRSALADRNFRGNPITGAGRFLALLHPDAKARAIGVASRFVHPEWLDAGDLPIGKSHQVGALIGPLDYYDPYHPAAIERVHPLLSQPLVELCLSAPTYRLVRGGQGRALARRAFANDIPREIAMRRSKGGIEQLATKVLRDNLPFAREMLLDGLLMREGLLDRTAVEAALSDAPAATAYISEVHTCIAVEAWARRIADRSAPTPD